MSTATVRTLIAKVCAWTQRSHLRSFMPEEKEARKNAFKNFRKLIRVNPKLAAKLVNMSPEEIAAALNPQTGRP